jgi:hypothetical protein
VEYLLPIRPIKKEIIEQLSGSRKASTVDLWARTTGKYFPVLKDRKSEIGNLQVLLMSEKAIRKWPTPHSEKEKERLIAERRLMIENWNK